jgi:hypothetical protein
MKKMKTASFCLLSLPPFLMAFLAVSTFSPLHSGGLTIGLALGLALVCWSGFCWRVLLKSPSGAAAPCAGLLFAGLGIVLATRALWQHRYDTFKKDCAAQGWPTSLADFREDRPEQDFAQGPLEQAYARLGLDAVKKDLESWGGPVLAPGESRPGGAWARACPKLEAGGVDAAFMTRSRLLRVDYAAAAADPMGAPIPAVGQHIAWGRWLRACASRAPDQGRAWAQVGRLLQLSQLVATHRSTIAQVVACESDILAAKTAIEVLLRRPRAALPEAVSRPFRERLRENRLAAGLRSELAMSFDMTAWFQGPGAAGVSRLGERVLSWIGFFEINGLAFSRMLAGFAGVKTWADAQAAGARVEAQVAGLPGWPYLLVRIAMPSYGKTFIREFEARTWCRMALVVSAAGRFMSAKGRPAKDLAELSPKFLAPGDALDESSGRDLAYRALPGQGFDLCGSGPQGDEKDSRGRDFCVRVLG